MVAPLPAARAWSVLGAALEPRVEPRRWSDAGQLFFDTALRFEGDSGEASVLLATSAAVELYALVKGSPGERRLRLVTTPLDAALRAHAERCVVAMGGAGFDVLVARAKRSWQLDRDAFDGGDDKLCLRVAATLAHALSAPILPPDELLLFGPKGARVRFER